MEDRGYHIRVTEPTEQELIAFQEYIEKHDGAYIVAREVGTQTEKPHIHAVVCTERKLATVRQGFFRMFNGAGNKKYSMKALVDIEGMARYVCKERNILLVHGLWARTPEQYADDYEKVQQGLIKDKRRASTPKWLQEVINEGIRQDYKLECDNDIRKWVEIIYPVIPCPDAYSIARAMHRVRRIVNPKQGVDIVVSDLFNSGFRV